MTEPTDLEKKIDYIKELLKLSGNEHDEFFRFQLKKGLTPRLVAHIFCTYQAIPSPFIEFNY